MVTGAVEAAGLLGDSRFLPALTDLVSGLQGSALSIFGKPAGCHCSLLRVAGESSLLCNRRVPRCAEEDRTYGVGLVARTVGSPVW